MKEHDRSACNSEEVQYAAFVGIDWADQEHAICIFHDGRKDMKEHTLEHSPETIAEWAESLRLRYDGRPVAVAVEQSRGGLVHALIQFKHIVLFPINPKQAARYREALSVSGKKDDPADARMLARLLYEHHEQLRCWKPDDDVTRELARLCELRRKTVGKRTQTGQQLRGILKMYFPQSLDIGGEPHSPMMIEMLKRWPSLKELQRAHPKTLRKFFRQYGHRNEEKVDALIQKIRDMKPLTDDNAIISPNAVFVQMLVDQLNLYNKAIVIFDERIKKVFAQHDDAELFRSLPGAGDALAPRLAAAMGSDRERFDSARDVQCYSGIAPVTKKSGQACSVRRRFACPKFLRQTFHEFADHARKWSSWSKAYYDYLRAKGTKHNAAVRSLAFKWIRIIFRLWKDRTAYDESTYLQQLKKRNSPCLEFLKSA
jgi:transposase